MRNINAMPGKFSFYLTYRLSYRSATPIIPGEEKMNCAKGMVCVFVCLFGIARPSACQASVAEIAVAVVLPLSGPAQTVGKAILDGTHACIEKANRAGGVHGKAIRLLVEDDQFNQVLTVDRLIGVLARSQPVAVLNAVGGGNNMALVKSGVIDREKLPVLSMTSSTEVRRLNNPNLYFVRAGIEVEAALMVRQAYLMGFRRFAAFTQDDESGRDGLHSIEKALLEHGLTLVAKADHKKGTTDGIDLGARKIAATAPDVILIHTLGPMAAAFRVEVLKQGSAAVMIASSSTSPEQVTQTIGAHSAHGMAIVRVVPDPNNGLLPIARQFRKAFSDALIPGHVSSFALEGCIGAEILVAALRRTSAAELESNPRRAVRNALQRINRFDLGGLDIGFSGLSRQGLNHVDIGIIGKDGVLRH
jgi:branched-chain amino acid transport system substrate-binding protein